MASDPASEPTPAKKALSLPAIPRPLAMALGVLAVLALLIGGLRIIYKPYQLSSTAMQPAIQPGDLILVNKFAYGKNGPKRGDIVVAPWRGMPFAHRVIGLTDDRVQMKEGKFLLNKKPLTVSCREAQDGDAKIMRCTETLPEGVSYDTLDRIPQAQLDNTPAFRTSGCYFLAGDDRDNSVDTRSTAFGCILKEDIVGRVDVVVPLSLRKFN
jgi:signal peptidase I